MAILKASRNSQIFVSVIKRVVVYMVSLPTIFSRKSKYLALH